MEIFGLSDQSASAAGGDGRSRADSGAVALITIRIRIPVVAGRGLCFEEAGTVATIAVGRVSVVAFLDGVRFDDAIAAKRVGNKLAVDFNLTVDQGSCIVVPGPYHQVVVARGVIRDARAESPEGDISVGRAHVADAEIVVADLGPRFRINALAEDFKLLIHQGRRIVISFPNDEIFIVDGIVRDLWAEGGESGVAVRAHVADAKIVVANFGPRRSVEALTEDLKFIVDERAGIVVSLPDDEVGIIGGAIGDAGKSSGKTSGSIRAQIADAKIVVADLGSRRGVEALTEDLKFIVDERAGIVVPEPDDEVFVVDGVVGDAGRRSAESGQPVRTHVTDAKVVIADFGPCFRIDALTEDFGFLIGERAGVVVAAPHH